MRLEIHSFPSAFISLSGLNASSTTASRSLVVKLQFHIAHILSLHFLLNGLDVILMLDGAQRYVQLTTRALLSIHQKVELADQLPRPIEEGMAVTNL